ncbi:MAG: ribose-phosphate diphosphokinase [Christensenellales bacterium]|jgi:ribose-phosphate pyrophosphokinase
MSAEGSGIIRIFAGSTGRGFAVKMCEYLGVPLGDSKTIRFSDNNIFVRINETIRDKDVYLVQPIGEDPNNEFVELLFWLDAFKRASANSVTAIIPFFGYAKGDKKDEPRVSIRARVCADCIEVAGADRVVTMDLHSPQVQGFFRKPVDHLYARKLLCEYVKRAGLVDNDTVVVSPDGGFAKNARAFADELGVPVAIGDKIRTGHDENAKIMSVIGDVDGKNCFIVDDFTISGGTLVDVANALKAKGAKRIFCGLSHMMLKEEGLKKVENSPIEFIVATDTVRCPFEGRTDKIRIISAAPLFAETIRRIHDRRGIGELVSNIPENVLAQSFTRQLSFTD